MDSATSHIKTYSGQIRPFLSTRYTVLGTDGFGRSYYRRNLRRFFEVDRYHVAVAALHTLAQDGAVPASTVAEAIAKYGIDPDKPDPVRV